MATRRAVARQSGAAPPQKDGLGSDVEDGQEEGAELAVEEDARGEEDGGSVSEEAPKRPQQKKRKTTEEKAAEEEAKRKKAEARVEAKQRKDEEKKRKAEEKKKQAEESQKSKEAAKKRRTNIVNAEDLRRVALEAEKAASAALIQQVAGAFSRNFCCSETKTEQQVHCPLFHVSADIFLIAICNIFFFFW